MYQSDEGERFWAEGAYYFDYALPDVFQFWHAVRANDLLGSVSDPFNSSWFLNPIEWLADISTPDASIPPIDDGNKKRMTIPHLLRWADGYGNSSIGRKYNTVYSNYLEYRNENWLPNRLYLIDLAVPKQSPSSKSPLPSILSSASEQQWIIRHEDNNGDNHFIFFNKETGKAITRGEGHEQPDQLQLLYYINDHSYLVDGGYDSASESGNSFTNGYLYNNVMHYSYGYLTMNNIFGYEYVNYQNYGGLESPAVSITKARKVSEHANVTNMNFRNISNNLKTMEGEVKLNIMQPTPFGNIYFEGIYSRKVVAVLGDSPYIVDFNMMKETNQPTSMLKKMHYLGNSEHLYNQSNHEDWSYWDISNNNPISGYENAKNLYIAALSEDQIDDDESYGNDIFTNESMTILEYPNYDPNSGNKDPYQVKRKMYAHSSSESDFALITFIKADDQTPQNSLEQLNLGTDIHAGYFKHENYLDVAILKHENTYAYSFQLTVDNLDVRLKLDSNEEYGFIRLMKENNEWVSDSDFTINLIQEPPKPSAPSNVTITNAGGMGFPNIDWDDNPEPDIDYYEVWRQQKRLSDGYIFSPVHIASPSSSNYMDPFVVMDLTSHSNDWRYAVNAVNNNDEESGFSHYTQWVNGNTPLKQRSDTSDPLPEKFYLEQNYPNPFNPTTKLKFALPEESAVQVTIYNIMGQQVATLVQENLNAGFHETTFNAKSLSSGMYLARIRAVGNSGEVFIQELKMQLIK